MTVAATMLVATTREAAEKQADHGGHSITLFLEQCKEVQDTLSVFGKLGSPRVACIWLNTLRFFFHLLGSPSPYMTWQFLHSELHCK
jgi:hypothetical protein